MIFAKQEDKKQMFYNKMGLFLNKKCVKNSKNLSSSEKNFGKKKLKNNFEFSKLHFFQNAIVFA